MRGCRDLAHRSGGPRTPPSSQACARAVKCRAAIRCGLHTTDGATVLAQPLAVTTTLYGVEKLPVSLVVSSAFLRIAVASDKLFVPRSGGGKSAAVILILTPIQVVVIALMRRLVQHSALLILSCVRCPSQGQSFLTAHQKPYLLAFVAPPSK